MNGQSPSIGEDNSALLYSTCRLNMNRAHAGSLHVHRRSNDTLSVLRTVKGRLRSASVRAKQPSTGRLAPLSKYTRAIIKVAKPESFDDLVKISALSHGTDVWHGNQRELVESGQISLSDCIASRDDIMLYLMNMTVQKDDAYRIMDSVRKGKGLTDVQKQLMKDVGVHEWYIQVCEKIRYLFPKAHAVSYTMMAVRLAYYMVYYSDEYYESLSEVS